MERATLKRIFDEIERHEGKEENKTNTLKVLDGIIIALTIEANRRERMLVTHPLDVDIRMAEGEVSGYRNAIQNIVLARDLFSEEDL